MSSSLPHGYTNCTSRIAPGRVLKRYEGPGAAARCRRERACLSALGAWLPVPAVVEHDPDEPSLVVAVLPGRPGQALVDEGHAGEVMGLVGQTLRAVQAVPVPALPDLEGTGPVLVHGDFGPQNMLFALGAEQPVTGLVDWEFAHRGGPVEDVAWAEWTVRMHHPAHLAAVQPLLEHAGTSASWSERHESMVRRCRELVSQTTARGSADGVAVWRRRLAATERWSES